MVRQSNTTTDHQMIRRWVEQRGGRPTAVRSTARGNDVGVLRIDFPGYSGEDSLEPISWEAFFEKFDEKRLAFVYQDQTSRGTVSRFSKLVSRDAAGSYQASEQARSAQQSTGHHQGDFKDQEQTPIEQAVQPLLEDLPQQVAEAVRQQIEEQVPRTIASCVQQAAQALESSGYQSRERQQAGRHDESASSE